MKSYLMRSLVVAILAVPLLIASCSKKDKGTGPAPGSAPTLAIPQFAQSVTFVGTNTAIQGAKTKVQSELALVGPWLVTPTAISAALNAGPWGAKSADSCWSKSSSQGNCTTSDKVCDGSAGSYDWSRTLSGNCSGVDHSSWIQYDGNTSADGGAGSLRAFASNTTDADTLWTWAVAADKNSKDWNVYHGAQSQANLLASLHWAKGSSNSSDWTFQQAGSATVSAGVAATDPAKWTLHVSSDAKAGTMDVYQWATTAGTESFWLQHHIAWNPDSSGTWQEYDAQGNLTHETTWPATGPNVQIPTFGHDVVFDTTLECAKMAHLFAGLPLQFARGLAGIGTGFLYGLDSANMGDQVDGCWNWTGSSQGCSVQYRLCQETDGYRWTWTLDGTCGGVQYSNWVELEVIISNDGRSGSIISYENGTTTVSNTWVWSTAADGKSGSFSAYNGAVLQENLQQQIAWSVGSDGATDVTFETFGSGRSKWVMHESVDGTSGFSKYYMWDETPPAGYWLQQEIIWNSDGSGSSKTYMQDGTIIDQCIWS